MNNMYNNNSNDLYSDICTCKCSCHEDDSSISDKFSMSNCTYAKCSCGKNLSSLKNSHFSLANNVGGLGRKDFSSSFRPINSEQQGEVEVLGNSFNIITLNNIRAGTLEKTLTPEKPEISSNASLLKPTDFTPSLFENVCEPNRTTPLLPPEFFTTPQRPASRNLSRNDSNNYSDCRGSNNSSARQTPLTCEDLTNRLVAPEEFTTATGGQLEKFFSNFEKSDSAKGFEPRYDHSTASSDSTSFNRIGFNDNNYDRNISASFESENPLGEFCSKIGITPDHNLPSIPGGKEILPRLSKPDKNIMDKLMQNDSNKKYSDVADKTSDSDDMNIRPLVPMETLPHKAPEGEKPHIAVFWDIENCQVPRNMDAGSIVRVVRKKFYDSHAEYEFYAVMDVYKEKEEIVRELQRAQITIVHVTKGEKNAADEKLVYLMGRYCQYHSTGHTCILISGDTNFTTMLHNMKHKLHMNVILLHNNVTNGQLKSLSHFHYNFSVVTEEAQMRPVVVMPKNFEMGPMIEYFPEAKFLAIHGLPVNMDYKQLKNRLHMLCENLGGKVFQVYAPHAFIDMRDASAAIRAKKYLDGEDVFQHRICCTITQACTLSNFRQAQNIGEISHECTVDDKFHDNICPSFKSPHQLYRPQHNNFQQNLYGPPNGYPKYNNNRNGQPYDGNDTNGCHYSANGKKSYYNGGDKLSYSAPYDNFIPNLKTKNDSFTEFKNVTDSNGGYVNRGSPQNGASSRFNNSARKLFSNGSTSNGMNSYNSSTSYFNDVGNRHQKNQYNGPNQNKVNGSNQLLSLEPQSRGGGSSYPIKVPSAVILNADDNDDVLKTWLNSSQ